jgi:hypothetical protein
MFDMATGLLESATAAVDSGRLQKYLDWFSKVRRDTGGPGEDQTAAFIAGELQAAGVPVTVHEFDAFLSYPIRATLEVLTPEGAQCRCVTHAFAKATGPDGLIADLVYLPDGNVAHGAGRAALVDGLATPVTVLRASKAGCAAIIFANQDVALHNMIVTTIWGTPGLDQLDRLPQIPAISVNKADGDRLKAILAKNQGARVKIVAEVKTGWTRSKLPEVRIPGSQEPDKFVLAGGHSCAWEVGVTDNGTGCSCLMEMARILWANRAGLKRSVRICWWPGHSHGRYSGSTWYADTFFSDLAEGCLAYHNIDSPGVKGATKYIARHTTAEAERFCQQTIERVTGQANAPIHRPSRAADQSFLANGVPSFSTYPFLPDEHPDRRPWTGGSANAWWWHSEFDTLDKADLNILALDTRVSLTAVIDLATAEVIPFDHTRTAAEIVNFLGILKEKAGAHLDLTPATTEAARYQGAAAAFQAAAAKAKGEKARLVNDTIMRLSRIVNPLIYTMSGRFHHDPAEWSPIMRATSQYTMPSLSKAAGLSQMARQPEYGFLKAQAIREQNRAVVTLREATRLIEETMARLA